MSLNGIAVLDSISNSEEDDFEESWENSKWETLGMT